MNEKKIMLGNEAIARGAFEAGVKVSAAYPGTPSTEISENIVKYPEIYAEWAPNEKVAMEVAIGASISGVRAMASMKHVGVNVAADPLYTISYCGVNGGLVLVAADDPGLYSSQNEQDTRCVARAAMVPVLEPSDSQEAKDFMKYAFELSEKYDTPVILRTTTRLSHSQGPVTLEDRCEPADVEYTRNPAKYVMMPGNAKPRHVYVEQRLKAMAEDGCTMPINKMEIKDTKIGFITSGIAYQYVKEACPDASVLKLGMVHPLPRKLIEDFACNHYKDKNFSIESHLEPLREVFPNAIKKGTICLNHIPRVTDNSWVIAHLSPNNCYTTIRIKLEDHPNQKCLIGLQIGDIYQLTTDNRILSIEEELFGSLFQPDIQSTADTLTYRIVFIY